MSKIFFKGSCMLNPVPSVLITSKSKNKDINVFTAAWVGNACTKPPMITVAIKPERLSYKYIKETMEFAVNLPSRNLTKIVDLCGVKSGKDFNKIKQCNLELEKSEKISVPCIKECAVNMECHVKSIIPLGSHHLFIAEILSVHVDETLIDNKGKIHLEKADLICYSHGEYFPINSKPLGKFGFSVKKKR